MRLGQDKLSILYFVYITELALLLNLCEGQGSYALYRRMNICCSYEWAPPLVEAQPYNDPNIVIRLKYTTGVIFDFYLWLYMSWFCVKSCL